MNSHTQSKLFRYCTVHNKLVQTREHMNSRPKKFGGATIWGYSPTSPTDRGNYTNRQLVFKVYVILTTFDYSKTVHPSKIVPAGMFVCQFYFAENELL